SSGFTFEQKLQHSMRELRQARMASAALPRDPSLDAEWEEWKMNFKKILQPEGHRRAVWEKNKKFIENHNANYEQGKTSFTMGLNGFSDMVSEIWIINSVLVQERSLHLVSWSSMFYLLFHEDTGGILDHLLWKIKVYKRFA
uniref:Cathepsin propeptide inhibitor domain-containing protein n=1 Tax=Peromyscus maniculatus bairdii TaxID=230844 RepID=A0A8C8W151_PERMB